MGFVVITFFPFNNIDSNQELMNEFADSMLLENFLDFFPSFAQSSDRRENCRIPCPNGAKLGFSVFIN